MNYIGCKLSLLPFLEASITAIAGKDCRIFCDLFAGTGSVGCHFKRLGYRVIANDIQYYSYVLNRHYIGNHRELCFDGLVSQLPRLSAKRSARAESVCDELMRLDGEEGFIYRHYCGGGTEQTAHPRLYFSDFNGRKCDAIRRRIEKWRMHKCISSDEYYFLLASLLESMDKCANTASVYGAFLKKLKKSAQQELYLRPAELIKNSDEHAVFNKDSNALIGDIESDILYLDPPYNSRQYASNYHFLETLACYDSPMLHGKTGLRDYRQQKSLYCSRSAVKIAFKELILKAKAKYIFLSYNNEGLMNLSDVESIMGLRGKYDVFAIEHNRFKADNSTNRTYKSDKTTEYLHYVVCDI